MISQIVDEVAEFLSNQIMSRSFIDVVMYFGYAADTVVRLGSLLRSYETVQSCIEACMYECRFDRNCLHMRIASVLPKPYSTYVYLRTKVDN